MGKLAEKAKRKSLEEEKEEKGIKMKREFTKKTEKRKEDMVIIREIKGIEQNRGNRSY